MIDNDDGDEDGDDDGDDDVDDDDDDDDVDDDDNDDDFDDDNDNDDDGDDDEQEDNKCGQRSCATQVQATCHYRTEITYFSVHRLRLNNFWQQVRFPRPGAERVAHKVRSEGYRQHSLLPSTLGIRRACCKR